jgi:hypothetical protein
LHNIVVDISGHGLGHLGQIAPVIRALGVRHPTARIVIRSPHAEVVVNDFVGANVAVDTSPPEATLVMRGPTVVDVVASATAYRELHAAWDEHLDRETARLATLEPNVLIADVPYLSLAAAKLLGIPAVALCSLNWADIYRGYCGEARDAPSILATIEAAYRSADLFLQPQPHMPMPDLSNRRSIGPIARIGQNRKDEIRALLCIPQDQRLILVSLGGIPNERRLQLPEIPGVHWLADKVHAAARGGVTELSRLGIRFIDLLASSDAVVTKVGYCMFVEAACNGIGLVSAPRDDWPESMPLIGWAKQNAKFALAVPGIEDERGLREALDAVLSAPRKSIPGATGAAEACEEISSLAGLF